jgi:hypothetical protein
MLKSHEQFALVFEDAIANQPEGDDRLAALPQDTRLYEIKTTRECAEGEDPRGLDVNFYFNEETSEIHFNVSPLEGELDEVFTAQLAAEELTAIIGRILEFDDFDCAVETLKTVGGLTYRPDLSNGC